MGGGYRRAAADARYPGNRTRTLTQERAAATAAVASAEAQACAAELAHAERLIAAGDALASRLAATEPIIVRSTDIVRTYAETPAGRVPCLGAERVRGIDPLDHALAEAVRPAGGGAGPVRADADAAAGGRVGDKR